MVTTGVGGKTCYDWRVVGACYDLGFCDRWRVRRGRELFGGGAKVFLVGLRWRVVARGGGCRGVIFVFESEKGKCSKTKINGCLLMGGLLVGWWRGRVRRVEGGGRGLGRGKGKGPVRGL